MGFDAGGWYVRCDKCYRGAIPKAAEELRIKKELRKEGWRIGRKYICPVCAAKRKEQRNADKQ